MSNSDPLPHDDVELTPIDEVDIAAVRAVDQLYRRAQMLDPDDRLRLVARLWKTLPRDHRSALVTLQLEGSHDDRIRSLSHDPYPPSEPLWPKIYAKLIAPDTTSTVYSAPRRFDLATIFAVTAAYSLLFGLMSAISTLPVIMVVIGGMLALIGVTQALFVNVANARAISVITGTIGFTIVGWVATFSMRHFRPEILILATLLGLVLGGAAGYLGGTLVGGVFLVADLLRKKFGRTTSDADYTNPLDRDEV